MVQEGMTGMKVVWTLLLCVLLALGAAGCEGEDTAPASSQTVVSLPEGTYGIGESVEELDTRITLRQYVEETGSDTAQPAEGNVFLLLEFRIDNLRDAELPISTQLSFAGTVDGQAVSPSTDALSARGSHSTLNGTVPVDGGIVGVVGFEVPKDWQVFQVDFHPEVTKSDCISFSVAKKA